MQIEGSSEISLEGIDVPMVSAQNFTCRVIPLIEDEAVKHLIVPESVGQHFLKNGGHERFNILGVDESPHGAVRDADGQLIGTKRLLVYSTANNENLLSHPKHDKNLTVAG